MFDASLASAAPQAASATFSPILRGQENQPLVAGDMMYFETSFPTYIYAVNLSDLANPVWAYCLSESDAAPSTPCCATVSRGLAYASGTIIANLLDGRVLALEAKSGKELWKEKSVDGQINQGQIAAPLVIHNVVIVRASGLQNYLRGYFTAFDLTTGQQKWRAYGTGSNVQTLIDAQTTVDAATQRPVGAHPALALAACSANQSNLEGVPPREWLLYDAQLNLLYHGSATPGDCIRAGDETKWGVTIFARKPDTGKVVWMYQMLQPGGWDFDETNANVLVELSVRGHATPALVHFDPSGFTYVLDRRSGQLVGSHTFDPTLRWATALER
jgi:alcohol dehydrogenase (cytochrome c)